jgi:PAS domain S-box-containing protein
LRWRPIAAVAVVLGLTFAGFIVARALAQRDANRDSERRIAIAVAQVESQVEVATSLTESLSQFMVTEGATGVTNDEFATNVQRWLSPAGMPAAAWAEEVQPLERAAYERRDGVSIVAPGARRRPEPPSSFYLPASLVSGSAPMNQRGVDLNRESGLAAALHSAIVPGGVGATPVAARSDGTSGLFLVAPAPNVIDGVLRPGAVVVFLSETTLRAAASNPAGLRFLPADGSAGGRTGGGTVDEGFAVAGERFTVAMPKEPVSGPAATLPWLILASGLLLAALAGALSVVAVRRARAQQDFDRIFNLSPDLVAVADFHGHFTRVNPAAEQVLGYTQEELLARPYLELVHPDDRERTAAEAAAIGQGKTTLSFENRLVRKDGSLRVFEWTATPVVEDAVMYGVARDVTERRQAETESERLAAEQAALRRVAELVARQAPPEQVFRQVTDELSRLLQVDMVRTVRFDQDGIATIVAARGIADDRLTEGANFEIPEGSGIDTVLRTGRPARVDNFAEVKGPIGAALREHGAGAGVAGPIVVGGRLWGAMAVGARNAEALPPGSEHRVAQFAELISAAISNVESRAQVEELAAEQAALRRVAELVAQQAPAEEVFGLVTDELNRLLDVTTVGTGRFEPDGTVTIMAVRGTAQDAFPPGTSVAMEGGSAIEQVYRTGRPAHVENYDSVGGQLGSVMRKLGAGWAAAGPIVVDGQLWGAMTVNSGSAAAYPPGAEQRVAQFTELVSTAISNIESRAKVERLAAEQSALRRVATLVAREHSPDDLFAALVEELGVLLGVDATAILRYDATSSATVVAGWSDGTINLPVGERLPLEGENLAGEVHRTGSPRRKEDYSGAPGVIAATVRELGIRSAVASPIVVEGATWGVIAVLSRQPDPLPSDTEARIAEFTRQAALAVANAKSRSDLAESRARIVRAGDEARRRFERDLHDGAQQRLVSLGLELRSAEATLPSGFGDLQGRLSRVVAGMNSVLDDLRELSRGLHPAVLSEDGLTPALSSLARRSAVPVDLRLDLGTERFDEPVEVAAYYAASEALTNTAKHAGASRVEVAATRREGWLELSVTDDGRGGADVSSGSGLTGLVDRVEAIGGTMHIESHIGLGTAVHVKLPIKTTQS